MKALGGKVTGASADIALGQAPFCGRSALLQERLSGFDLQQTVRGCLGLVQVDAADCVHAYALPSSSSASGASRLRASPGIATSDGPARYVFVVGTGRCGSTMVEEVLARHSDAGFLSNLEDRSGIGVWARRWNNQIYQLVPPTLTRKGRLRFAPSEGYRVLDREVSTILSRPFRDLTAADVTPWLAARTRTFFDRCAAIQGRPVFLHKFTGWPRAGFLAGIFPEAKFIHVVRDGRAVANSWLQMDWWEGFNGPDHWQWGPLPAAYLSEWRESGFSFPVLAGLLWKLLIDAHDAAAATLPPGRWLEVRYEDVVESPAKAFATMLEFAGLPASATFNRALGRLPFGKDRTQAFRRDLETETVAALSSSLEKYLERLRYPI